MPKIVADRNLVACCGLYCAACRSHLKGKCPGCREHVKAGWCKVRACCGEKGIDSCAACDEFAEVTDCPKFNNIVARLFGFVLRSDRAACVAQIKALGLDGHAQRMAASGWQTIRRA